MGTNFKEKVQAMTAKEIIMAMVEGLQNPLIKIDMYDFGRVSKGVCFGCAATNTVCKIANKTFNEDSIYNTTTRAEFIGADFDFLNDFEGAIDCLRTGSISGYNYHAEGSNIAKIDHQFNMSLPSLTNEYTPEDLQAYINLANAQQ